MRARCSPACRSPTAPSTPWWRSIPGKWRCRASAEPRLFRKCQFGVDPADADAAQRSRETTTSPGSIATRGLEERSENCKPGSTVCPHISRCVPVAYSSRTSEAGPTPMFHFGSFAAKSQFVDQHLTHCRRAIAIAMQPRRPQGRRGGASDVGSALSRNPGRANCAAGLPVPLASTCPS